MVEAFIENGFARVPAGKWLTALGQPVASKDAFSVSSQRGFFVPDRGLLQLLETQDDAWYGLQARPFLTRLDALPDEALSLVSAKLLLAPLASRVGAKRVKLIPLSMRFATVVTSFQGGWAIAATSSRVTRVVVAEAETLSVRPEALVAWIGKDPSGFCPKLRLLDLLLPRGPRRLAFSFHGPCTVWFEGGREVASVKKRMAV